MRALSPVWWHLVRRGVLAWVLVRLVFAIALVLTLESPTASGGLVALGVVVLSTSVAMLEVARVHERILLANLGLDGLRLLAAFASASVLGELLFALVLP